MFEINISHAMIEVSRKDEIDSVNSTKINILFESTNTSSSRNNNDNNNHNNTKENKNGNDMSRNSKQTKSNNHDNCDSNDNDNSNDDNGRENSSNYKQNSMVRDICIQNDGIVSVDNGQMQEKSHQDDESITWMMTVKIKRCKKLDTDMNASQAMASMGGQTSSETSCELHPQ